MKAKKQVSFDGTKALYEHLQNVSATNSKKIVVVDCCFGETHHRTEEERHIFEVCNYAPASSIKSIIRSMQAILTSSFFCGPR